MSGQYYFSFLNPTIALAFGLVFLLLWRRWRGHVHLLVIAIAFTVSAFGFIFQDFGFFGNELAGRTLSNAAFLLCIGIACSAAMLRVGAKVPVATLLGIGVASLAAYGYFLYVSPSVMVRIAIMGSALSAFSFIAFWTLSRRRPLSSSDRLVALAALFGFVVSVTRPMLAFSGVLETGGSGEFQQSSYWMTVQAFSPIISGMVALLFLAAMSMDALERLRSEANHDYLTGLLNRRGFESAVGESLAAARTPLSALLMADIDNFKSINDRFGHKVGDQVIAAVGRALSAHGNAMFSGRVGGEEFALYYEGVDRANLRRNADLVREAVTDLDVEGLPEDHRLTVSIGVHVRRDQEDLAAMLIEADRALYKAKRAGKDRAVITPVSLKSLETKARMA